MGLQTENILIVDDNFDMLELLHRNLKSMHYHTYKASSVAEAMNVLKYSAVDLLITDLQMPGGSGIELLQYISLHFPSMPRLVITGFPSVDTALSATKLGAHEYLIKPFTADEFRKAVDGALAQKAEKEVGALNVRKQRDTDSYAGMVGKSRAMHNIIDIIERVKDNRATVLIGGESGTGKELIARAIHFKGSFAANPFIAVHCGALPESLIESELFGHVKGSFSGAAETKKGLFESADGGTIFLDEIGTVSLPVQVRLLRVLQEREVRKVGGNKPVKVNLRIIAATNENLKDLVRQGKFREDLYYRLNVVEIETAPLRDRKDDIPLLVEVFRKKYAIEYGKPQIAIAPEVMKLLITYSWPGNIRELENTVQRMIIMGDQEVFAHDLPQGVLAAKPSQQVESPGLISLKDAEQAYIRKVLAAVGNNKTKAAQILQIDRKTLRSKLS